MHWPPWWDVLAAAEESGYLDESEIRIVTSFLESPEGWSANHGGKTSAEIAAG